MEIIIVGDAVQVGLRAAALVAESVVGRDAPVLGVATGGSPLTTYEALADLVQRGDLDLSGARAFALDEYVGLGADDERSYAATLRRTVAGPLGLDPARVHVPDGLATDLDAACAAHEQAIREAGEVDVQILGIGRNGHIGFNEPGSHLDSRTRVEVLAESTREANARYFASPDEVPSRCLTQGLGTILEARHLVLVAIGQEKAPAVAAMVEGPVTPLCPASVLQRHPRAAVVLDEAAASRLGSATR